MERDGTGAERNMFKVQGISQVGALDRAIMWLICLLLFLFIHTEPGLNIH